MLSARSVTQRFIEVTGVIGDFSLENKAVKVRYFSTIASSSSSSTQNLDFLKELRPMRERVKASELKDLDSLLQRNLNDNRVSSELIPYLINSIPQVAFFTPILAVLIPKDSLNSEGESNYPIPSKLQASNGNTILNYDSNWLLEYFKINNLDSNLGILSFDPNKVDLVVLDGQHRANAFRVVSGAYNEKDTAVYPAFYNQITVPKNFNADLPVTVIWFEVEKAKFDPKIVSRRLFVDVNNTAKRVAKSRTILLEENEITSSIVRFFYSQVAKSRSFERDKFSLFHSGFDIDSDINVSSDNPFALTNPQIFYDIVAWLALGSKRYNSLGTYNVSREAFKNSTISFNEIFSGQEFNAKDILESEENLDNKKIIISNPERARVFEAEYLKNLHSTFMSFFDNFNLLGIHYKACKVIDEWNLNGMDSTEMIAWNEIFCGGEGLYYTFKDSSIDKSKREVLARFFKAMQSIEERFKTERANLLPGCEQKEINAAFESISTKAFQVGIFMALDMYRNSSAFEDNYESFITRLNTISEKNWVYILTSVRRKLMPRGATPKHWPTYQKLILRLIQTDENPYYSDSNFRQSPDGKIFESAVKSLFDSYYETNDDIDIDTLQIDELKGNIEGWAVKAKTEVEDLYRPIGMKVINAKFEAIAQEIVLEKIQEIRG